MSVADEVRDRRRTVPLTRDEAQALVLDLTRRSTPAEASRCTIQVVVDGETCPWKLDCEHCDKFVITGADLLYWRRKRELRCWMDEQGR